MKFGSRVMLVEWMWVGGEVRLEVNEWMVCVMVVCLVLMVWMERR
jgi:hypothetical protein